MKPDLTAAELVEKLEALIADAYSEGALDVHNAWVAGDGQSEPDFGEAAGDYTKSLDLPTILTALRAQTAGEDERASIVAWLRREASEYQSPLPTSLINRTADAIERGDHTRQQAWVCTCLTELEDDAYSPGGPMSGHPKPAPCPVHSQQENGDG